VTRDEVIAELVGTGSKRDVAAQYADAYLEYHEAAANIRTQGAMVLHPRTSNPIENPYLQIRDRALSRMQRMKVRAEKLW
jgi:phage terminase small subunit